MKCLIIVLRKSFYNTKNDGGNTEGCLRTILKHLNTTRNLITGFRAHIEEEKMKNEEKTKIYP